MAWNWIWVQRRVNSERVPVRLDAEGSFLRVGSTSDMMLTGVPRRVGLMKPRGQSGPYQS